MGDKRKTNTLRAKFYDLRSVVVGSAGFLISNKRQQKMWKHHNTTRKYKAENYEREDYVEIWNRLIKPLKTKLKGKVVYDYGCSNGVWSLKYIKLGAKVTGIDYSNPKQYEGKKLVVDNIITYSKPKSAFLIHASRVLEHLDKREQVECTKNVYKNLVPGGYFMVLEPHPHRGPLDPYTTNRVWTDTLEFYGFKIVNFVSDGIIQGILAQKPK